MTLGGCVALLASAPVSQKTECEVKNNDSREDQRTVSQENSIKRMWRGGTLGYPPLWTLPGIACECAATEKMSRKGRTERRFSNQAISHFMCGSPSLPRFLSISLSPPFFLSLIGAHSLVFHHTYPHLNFTNPIYCYLYPWLLLSLLLLLLLLWLELLSLRAIFSFYFHGLKYWFFNEGGLFG